jgi:nucleoside-diphosphate-sugar epimerase
MKTAVITGANGFLGSALANFLAAKGVQVICLGRRPLTDYQLASQSKSTFKYFEISMEEIAKLETLKPLKNTSSSGGNVFFHFAWQGDTRLTDGDLSQQLINATYTSNAVKVAKKIGCDKFVNCGSQEESFVEEIISNKISTIKLTQQNYALAKLASRDLATLTSYLEKIDYVHTRVSAPISQNLARNNFIESNLRRIKIGEEPMISENEKLVDIVAVNDVSEAYYKIGVYGKNKSNYYIGTKTQMTLNNYFKFFKNFLNKEALTVEFQQSSFHSKIFNSIPLENDTGFVPSKNFLSSLKDFK